MQVVISGVNEDSTGTFDPTDAARYMPFEGTGAVSSWQLEVGNQGINPGDITGVAVKLFYTAKSDRGKFRVDVTNALGAFRKRAAAGGL